MNIFTHFSGEFAALLAAFLWAFASVLFKELGKKIQPIELNIIKGIGGFVFLSITCLLLKEVWSGLSILVIVLLLLSGAIGIGFGDTMYFAAINRMGPRHTLLVGTLAPIITALLAFVFIGETIRPYAWLGVAVTAAGIAWVVTAKKNDGPEKGGVDKIGILYALLFALAQAIGSVISRWALTNTTISALQSSIVRMLAGTLFALTWAWFRHIRLGEWTRSSADPMHSWSRIIIVIIFGAYLPLWLQQIAFKNTQVGIAQTMLATSPLFILPITALHREKITWKEVLGAVISLTGIAILFLA